jgi:hypothetical protein
MELLPYLKKIRLASQSMLPLMVCLAAKFNIPQYAAYIDILFKIQPSYSSSFFSYWPLVTQYLYQYNPADKPGIGLSVF